MILAEYLCLVSSPILVIMVEILLANPFLMAYLITQVLVMPLAIILGGIIEDLVKNRRKG